MKKGVIEAVKKAKSGEKTYRTLKIDGDWYSLWGKLANGIEKGSTVVFSYQKRKKGGKEYKNITEIHPIGDSKDGHMDEGKVLGLNAATRFLAGSDVKISQVLKVAEEFESWLSDKGEKKGG